MLLNQALGLPIRQSDVDFVIPNLKEDLRLYVDPFLFYKSRNPAFQAVHAVLRRFFEVAIDQIRQGTPEIARRMMSFPEVDETMLGHSKGSHRGRGMGKERGEVIHKEIVNNPDIQERGIRHLAEMQLLIAGVGPDLISDMCTNIAKPFFVDYTQRQCDIHGIPLEAGLCLKHVFDWEELDWDDAHVELPVNPLTEKPILLVPRAVVRKFVEIDYEDFWDRLYRYILREIEVRKSVQVLGREPKITWKEINEKYGFCKQAVIRVLHEEPDLRHEYVDEKEKTSIEVPEPVDITEIAGADREKTPVEELVAELGKIRPGNKDAKKYEALLVRILTRLFWPSLQDPHPQVSTVDGREIIDITFYNAADHGFWKDIKDRHGSTMVVVELKNMEDLSNEEYFQISARLDSKRGMFGILVARKKDRLDVQRAHRRLNHESKVILTLTDDDLVRMLTDVAQGLSATMYLRGLYRKLLEES
ncbi:MAG: hypothetical protein H0U67_04740 [Gemmatimonadetes bacterium]|nr:hypothetical protein [Gemmatimonadota bacterium]